MRARDICRVLLFALPLGAAAAYVALGATHQWDFETYYYAATAYRAGQNPYTLQSLSAVAGKPVELPFLYPPVTLALIVPLTFLGITPAAGVWLGFKCALLLLLVWIWHRDFLRSAPLVLLVTVALFGFDLAMLWDLRTGNVALVEGTLLWLAFSAYLRKRIALAVCLIALASVFKLVPVVLLGLVLLAPKSLRVRLTLIGAGHTGETSTAMVSAACPTST